MVPVSLGLLCQGCVLHFTGTLAMVMTRKEVRHQDSHPWPSLHRTVIVKQDCTRLVKKWQTRESPLVLHSADCKRGRRKGATSKNVKNRQKVSKSVSTLFDNFRAGQKTSKIVKKCQKVFRHFSTIFARHLFSGPFCNPLIHCVASERNEPKNGVQNHKVCNHFVRSCL